MDKDKIIDGLRMTMDLCVFDPSTGEEIDSDMLNDINRATYDACKGALEILERFDTDSDTISRKAAIEALERDMASLDRIIKGMSANDVRLDAYVSQRNQVNYDIYTINNLPPVQPEQLGTNLAEVGTDCISRQAAIEAADAIIARDKSGNNNVVNAMIAWREYIKHLQPEQPKMGKWILDGHHVRCDQCGMYMCNTDREGDPIPRFFCPNCGADMRGEQK